MTRKENISIALIAGMAACIVLLLGLFTQARDDNFRKDSIIAEKNAEIQYRVNKEGKIVAEKQAAQATAKQFAEAYPQLANELMKQFDVKIKDLRAVIQAEFQARGSGNATTNVYNYYDTLTQDSVKAIAFKVNDGYLNMDATILPDRSPYEYVYQDTLTYGFTVKKKWALGKETLYGFGGLKNPNAKVTSATNVLIDSYNDKRWVLSAGVSYAPFTKQVLPTVTFGYAIVKF
jgi:hypothetical protein